MMLYESIHLQTSDVFHDANIKFKEKKPLTKNNSASQVDKLFRGSTDITRAKSFVVGQKLRESKWFKHDEMKILCAVLETGFIVERKTDNNTNIFGIALWTPGYEKSKDHHYISIYTLKEQKGNFKVQCYSLEEFWPMGTSLRINNQADKTNSPHPEDIIRNQVAYAENNKPKWHNSEHFTYWCRYGPPQINRTKHTSENIRGINFGLHAGFAMLRRMRRNSHK